jgi:hypothetical protein
MQSQEIAGLTFAELARRSPPERFAEDNRGVITEMYPSRESPAGRPLKVGE